MRLQRIEKSVFEYPVKTDVRARRKNRQFDYKEPLIEENN